VAVTTDTTYAPNNEDRSEEPIDDVITSSLPYHLDQNQPVELGQEVNNQDKPVTGPFELFHAQTAAHKAVDEEVEESSDPLKKENAHDVKLPSDKKKAAVRHEYYIQVGSWKNLNYAEEQLIKLKEMYPDVELVRHNNFYKVRILGVMSKQQGAVISKNIEKKFNVKSLLVLTMRNIRNASLDDAVRPFIGTSYRNIDCYGLLVRGLINLGIQYHGQGGLREKLETLALMDGLPKNAYLNGEGLVEKAGTIIFSDFIRRIANIPEETDKIYSEIAPYLREGIILSFSTTTRGHTGIVSRWEDEWTYINSGLIDNQITSSDVSEGVGEEFLKAEIRNWVVLASGRKEPLTVTLGKIDENQLKDADWLHKTNKVTAMNIY
jgi:hypothetical protein